MIKFEFTIIYKTGEKETGFTNAESACDAIYNIIDPEDADCVEKIFMTHVQRITIAYGADEVKAIVESDGV